MEKFVSFLEIYGNYFNYLLCYLLLTFILDFHFDTADAIFFYYIGDTHAIVRDAHDNTRDQY